MLRGKILVNMSRSGVVSTTQSLTLVSVFAPHQRISRTMDIFAPYIVADTNMSAVLELYPSYFETSVLQIVGNSRCRMYDPGPISLPLKNILVEVYGRVLLTIQISHDGLHILVRLL
jgi:hypothetical protein